MVGASIGNDPATPAVITYSVNGGITVHEEFDFIVVACDPRNLKISDRTDFENEVIHRLTSHTFHTSLFSANRPNREETAYPPLPQNGPPQTNYCVRFDPEALERMDGSLYGFRDEVMARDPQVSAEPHRDNLDCHLPNPGETAHRSRPGYCHEEA